MDYRDLAIPYSDDCDCHHEAYDFENAARERAIALDDLLTALYEGKPTLVRAAITRAEEVMEHVDVDAMRTEEWYANIDGNADFMHALAQAYSE